MAKPEHASAAPENTCCGVIEEAAARRDRRRQQPQPWLVLKATIGITLAIVAYASYVYIGRLCVPMITHNRGALAGGRATGIGFLVVFCIVLFMMLWAYAKVVLTPPGFARDYVQKSPAPLQTRAVPTWWDSESDLGATEYQDNTQARSNAQPMPQPHRSRSHRGARDPDPGREEETAGVTDAMAPVAHARAAAQQRSPARGHDEHGSASAELPMMHTRRPPTTPQLLPEFRYCHRDGFVKPLRAHHCRACGTCVLGYDHHCPWIGQCCGARNHKFFVNFTQWGFVFCLWTFATLVAEVSTAGRAGNADPQEIAVIALSGLFGFFTAALLAAHVSLILQNLTTVESLGVRRIKEREKRVLARLHSWWQFSARRATKAQWDAEWGRINEEGNIWSLGDSRKNWEAVMGHHVWEWILPVGRSDGDGVTFPVNPRFDAEGRWRPRKEWPLELQ